MAKTLNIDTIENGATLLVIPLWRVGSSWGYETEDDADVVLCCGDVFDGLFGTHCRDHVYAELTDNDQRPYEESVKLHRVASSVYADGTRYDAPAALLRILALFEEYIWITVYTVD